MRRHRRAMARGLCRIWSLAAARADQPGSGPVAISTNPAAAATQRFDARGARVISLRCAAPGMLFQSIARRPVSVRKSRSQRVPFTLRPRGRDAFGRVPHFRLWQQTLKAATQPATCWPPPPVGVPSTGPRICRLAACFLPRRRRLFADGIHRRLWPPGPVAAVPAPARLPGPFPPPWQVSLTSRLAPSRRCGATPRRSSPSCRCRRSSGDTTGSVGDGHGRSRRGRLSGSQ